MTIEQFWKQKKKYVISYLFFVLSPIYFFSTFFSFFPPIIFSSKRKKKPTHTGRLVWELPQTAVSSSGHYRRRVYAFVRRVHTFLHFIDISISEKKHKKSRKKKYVIDVVFTKRAIFISGLGGGDWSSKCMKCVYTFVMCVCALSVSFFVAQNHATFPQGCFSLCIYFPSFPFDRKFPLLPRAIPLPFFFRPLSYRLSGFFFFFLSPSSVFIQFSSFLFFFQLLFIQRNTVGHTRKEYRRE